MSIILKKELDPIYETLALLSVENPDKWREEVMSQAGADVGNPR